MGNIAISGSNLTSLRIGNNQVNSVYIGNDLIFSTSSRLLDLFPADYAYSLRKLRTAYTGSCLRVRRTTTTPSVTTTQVDVAFDSNNTISFSSSVSYATGTATTATTLGQFVAVGSNPDSINVSQSLFVSLWYDQSGNGRNMVQATAARQPRLVETGLLEIVDGSVGIRWINTAQHNMTGTSGRLIDMSAYTVTNPISSISHHVGLITHRGGLTTVEGYVPIRLTDNLTYVYYQQDSSLVFPGITPVAGQDRLYELLIGPNTSSATTGYSNGELLGAVFTLLPSVSTSVTSLGFVQIASTLNYMNGHVKEAIVLQGSPQRRFIEYNINSYYNIWS